MNTACNMHIYWCLSSKQNVEIRIENIFLWAHQDMYTHHQRRRESGKHVEYYIVRILRKTIEKHRINFIRTDDVW